MLSKHLSSFWFLLIRFRAVGPIYQLEYPAYSTSAMPGKARRTLALRIESTSITDVGICA